MEVVPDVLMVAKSQLHSPMVSKWLLDSSFPVLMAREPRGREPVPNVLIVSSPSPSLEPEVEWTSEEDEELLKLADIYSCNWELIAPMFGYKPADCGYRYYELIYDLSPANMPTNNADSNVAPIYDLIGSIFLQ